LPNVELKEWVELIKDALLAIAALVTIFVGIYGVRTWKRDLVGKEVFSAAKELVRESHLICRAARKMREPIRTYERKSFTEEEIQNTTENERWRITEADAYRVRVEAFSKVLERYEATKLELRVLVGSKIYEGFLPLGTLLTESISLVNHYLDVIQDYSLHLSPESEEVLAAQKALYPSHNLDDDLSQKIADEREAGEVSLLAYLHRKSIRG
jgi:hypothetical protein